ncbi:NAD(P)H-hydrate dehydratase [Natronoglomus mannanivorans]|uniref:ADP-dependent (S)-NAD(P)H-hydrate dehydratase n=1 Tax=Natronoglomus mannanivorans TaxID=2979990 RepID=A0AAP2Z104_9EURY|nr:NAD(P)H-hydrate dehydratase [Halobacteria archaeon AArc-xg1-1]
MERLLKTIPHVSGTSKGDTGRVGVIGGNVAYPGQPALAGLAALRTGTDVVQLLVSEEIHTTVASYSPNLLTDRYAGTHFTGEALEDAFDLAEWADALIVGPGFVDPEPAAVQELIAETEIPVVVDATAIGPALGGELAMENTVFTPDSAEEEWIDEEYGSIEAFSTETDTVVALTGGTDVIVADGDRRTNETGTSALTVAGTGDTLTGIVASLLGQGLERAEAAELGAWILGKSGELASAEYGAGVVATDVIERVPDTIR